MEILRPREEGRWSEEETFSCFNLNELQVHCRMIIIMKSEAILAQAISAKRLRKPVRAETLRGLIELRRLSRGIWKYSQESYRPTGA